jgi:hypothetical protein
VVVRADRRAPKVVEPVRSKSAIESDPSQVRSVDNEEYFCDSGIRIVHAYFDVDLEIVWTISREELPKLTPPIRSLRAETVDDTTETS